MYYFHLFIYFWPPWVFTAAKGFLQVRGLLLLPGMGSGAHRLQQLWHMGLVAPPHVWNLPRPVIKPVSPALADSFLTTGPPIQFSSVQSLNRV